MNNSEKTPNDEKNEKGNEKSTQMEIKNDYINDFYIDLIVLFPALHPSVHPFNPNTIHRLGRALCDLQPPPSKSTSGVYTDCI